MKRTIQWGLVALLVLALPVIAQAQNDVCVGTVCWSPTAEEIAAQSYHRGQHNAGVCTSVALPASCTQAEYDAVEPAPPAAVVYTNDAAGVRAFYSAKMKAASLKDVAAYEGEYKGRASNAWNDALVAQRQAACQALGKAADCTEL